MHRFQAKPPGEKHDDAAFGAMLFDIDESIGQVMDLVKELGIEDNTYIVLIADNGGVAYCAQTSQIDAETNILGTFRTQCRGTTPRCGKANTPSTKAVCVCLS